jgi:arylsulfatase A-like enzyme/tetratricopeptide (TPR) repeat protein
MSRVPLLLIASTAVAAGCHREGGVSVATGTPVVLVSIDTLRADHLPAYGYRAVATPHIDALARRGIVFENAYTPCPLTLPAHVSMLTGLLPPAHGVRNNLGYTLKPGATPTLQELLRAKGYATGAAVSAYVMRGDTGLRAGFDFYDEVPPSPVAAESAGRVQRPGAETAARLLEFARGVGGKPAFLFLHLYEPHLPYEPPEPFRSASTHPYDGEIATADAVVGEFLSALEADGVLDRALVILTSDHGEGLGDHGEADHGILLYREALHVPLIIKLPGDARAGTRVATPAGLIDLLPTLGAAMDLRVPGDLPGRSLFAEATERRLYAETYYPRIHLGWSELHSLVDARHHLVTGVRDEVFALQADPGERTDLSRAQSAMVERWRAELRRLDSGFSAPGRSDPEAVERLRALGYLGGSAPGVAAEGPRPDPRDQLPLLDDLKHAFGLAGAGKDAEAVTAFRALLARNPRLFDAQFGLAESLARLGRAAEADAAFVRAQELWPSPSGEIALARARLAVEDGRYDEAARQAAGAVASAPAAAHAILARVALARDDLPAAEQHARQALGASKRDVGAALVLAEVHLRRNRSDAALQLLDDLAREQPSGRLPRDVAFLRGDALARLNRFPEAEAAFDQEIAAFPDNAQAYARLAIVWGLRGRTVREVRALLETMHARRPGPETARLAAQTLESMGDPSGAAAWRRRAGGPRGQ